MNQDQWEPIQHAIALANAGNCDQAAILLRQIIQGEPRSITAWKWLAHCTRDPHEAALAIERVLRLRPEDRWAREAWPLYQERLDSATLSRTTLPTIPPRSHRHVSTLPFLILAALLVTIALVMGLSMERAGVAGLPTLEAITSLSDLSDGFLEQAGQAQIVAAPRLVTSSSEEYYTFEAGNITDIQQALYSQGPRIGNSLEHSIAVTNYELYVTWQMTQTLQTCRVDDVVVNLNIDYTYPEWTPIGTPESQVFGEWERFMEHVIAHEEHHGEIALQCAQDLITLLQNFQPGPTCSQAQVSLDKLVQNLYATCEARQQAFDAVHGRTSFPLP
jgi:predicted secreted Zn-dependent protease